jgi:hypothetical protein
MTILTIKMQGMAIKNHARFNPRMLFLICSMMSSMLSDLRKIWNRKIRVEYHKIAEFTLKNKCYKVSEKVIPFIKFRLLPECYSNWKLNGKIYNDYVAELSPISGRGFMFGQCQYHVRKGEYDNAFNELEKLGSASCYQNSICVFLR